MKGVYNVYRMFYNPIESLLYRKNRQLLPMVGKDEHGEVVAKTIIDLKLKLRKAKYIEECVRNGEINETDDNQQRIDSILAIQEQIRQLEEQSLVGEVRQNIHRVMRKCLINCNWQELHFLYVFLWVVD